MKQRDIAFKRKCINKIRHPNVLPVHWGRSVMTVALHSHKIRWIGKLAANRFQFNIIRYAFSMWLNQNAIGNFCRSLNILHSVTVGLFSHNCMRNLWKMPFVITNKWNGCPAEDPRIQTIPWRFNVWIEQKAIDIQVPVVEMWKMPRNSFPIRRSLVIVAVSSWIYCILTSGARARESERDVDWFGDPWHVLWFAFLTGA